MEFSFLSQFLSSLQFRLQKTDIHHCKKPLPHLFKIANKLMVAGSVRIIYSERSTWNILSILNFNYGKVQRLYNLQGLYQYRCLCGQQ